MAIDSTAVSPNTYRLYQAIIKSNVFKAELTTQHPTPKVPYVGQQTKPFRELKS